MPRRMFMSYILNDTEPKVITEDKGVCKRCGHYTVLIRCKMGVRVCRECQSRIEQELKRDYL